jgi:hypothetical protein
MEDLFYPTTRFRDDDDDDDHDDDDEDEDEDEESSVDGCYKTLKMRDLVELELIPGFSAEDILLHRGFKWSGFYSWARGKIVWISPDVFFDMTSFATDFQRDYRPFLKVSTIPNEDDTSKVSKSLWLFASSEAHATVASYLLLQLLTTCESREVSLRKCNSDCEFQIPGLAFSHFLVNSHDLRVLRLDNLYLDVCHCRAIDDLAGTNLQIELIDCVPTEFGESVLVESIRRNRGPTKLIQCRIDTLCLAEALRGNNMVNSLDLHASCSDEDKLVLVQALSENEGLVTLRLNSAPVTDESWIALLRSVARHPTHEKIVLRDRYSMTWRDGTTDAQKTLRSQALTDALHTNTVLHTVTPIRDDFDEEIWDNTIHPLFLANRYRPRVRAIAKEEGPWRRKLLGRALESVASNPALIWMFLSGNANVRLGRVPLKRKRAPDSDVPEPCK